MPGQIHQDWLTRNHVINAWLNRRAEASVTAVASKAKQLRAKRRAQRQEVASGRANNSCVSSGSEEKDQACTTDDTSQDVASTLTNSFARTRVSDQDDGPMDVLIMVAGTRGDVQPATALGLRLASHGHRVRMVTHKPYKSLVEGAGLQFMVLGGDPKGMMELTVKHRGMLFSDVRDLMWLRDQYWEIMESGWDAACDPTPPAGTNGVFKPDLVIATAITYGASAMAEALDAPLHTISTIPWRPTGHICHPWARGFDDTFTGHVTALASAMLPTPPANVKGSRLLGKYAEVRQRALVHVAACSNWWSTTLLDHMAWLGIVDLTLKHRRRLGLPLLSWHSLGWTLYTQPTTFTFSPSLVCWPSDWGSHIQVSGPLLLPAEVAAAAGGSSTQQTAAGAAESYTAPAHLVEFISAGTKPVYIGFGSMTVEGPSLAHAICTALHATGERAIIGVGGWGCLKREDFNTYGSGQEEGAGALSPDQLLLVEDVPHDWLFPRCSAVVHHGGVGTTAAGLMAGCPTFIAPSFGDLFFWGEVCAQAGVGPAPVPVYKLNAHHLTSALKALRSSHAMAAAHAAGRALRAHDGVHAATSHIYRCISYSQALSSGRSGCQSPAQVKQDASGLSSSADSILGVVTEGCSYRAGVVNPPRTPLRVELTSDAVYCQPYAGQATCRRL